MTTTRIALAATFAAGCLATLTLAFADPTTEPTPTPEPTIEPSAAPTLEPTIDPIIEPEVLLPLPEAVPAPDPIVIDAPIVTPTPAPEVAPPLRAEDGSIVNDHYFDEPQEDSPDYDCRIHGNHTCGVVIEGAWYLVTFVDGFPSSITLR